MIGSFYWFSKTKVPLAILLLAIGGIGLLIFVFRHKISVEYKILLTCMNIFIFALQSLVNNGFIGSGIIVLALLVNIIIIFFSPKVSILLNFIIIIGFVILSVLVNLDFIDHAIHEISIQAYKSEWYAQIYTLVIFIIASYASIYTIKHLLIRYIQDYEKANRSLLRQKKALSSQQKSLEQLAFYDQLTHIYNKYYMMNVLPENKQILDSDQNIVLVLDIRELNVINSYYGMAQGEKFLQDVVKVLQDNKPQNSYLGRVSSDEIMIVFTETDLNTIEKYRLTCIKGLLDYKEMTSITAHNGFYIAYQYWKSDSVSIDKVYNDCQMAILHAKENRINQMVLYQPEMSLAFNRAYELLASLSRAMKNNEFQVWFQGKYCLDKDQITGYEALARWVCQDNTFISPGEFIPLINQSKYLKDFSLYILRMSIEEFEKIQKRHDHPLILSLNISPLFFMNSEFERYINQALDGSDINKTQIILELTEDVFIDDYQSIANKVKSLRQEGYQISLDDFGSGYSSLSHINAIDINEIKLDRSIIRKAQSSLKSKSIVELVSEMAVKLDLQVTAEGVETLEEVEMLKQIGIKMIQGFYYSKPQSADSIVESTLEM